MAIVVNSSFYTPLERVLVGNSCGGDDGAASLPPRPTGLPEQLHPFGSKLMNRKTSIAIMAKLLVFCHMSDVSFVPSRSSK